MNVKKERGNALLKPCCLLFTLAALPFDSLLVLRQQPSEQPEGSVMVDEMDQQRAEDSENEGRGRSSAKVRETKEE